MREALAFRWAMARYHVRHAANVRLPQYLVRRFPALAYFGAIAVIARASSGNVHPNDVRPMDAIGEWEKHHAIH